MKRVLYGLAAAAVLAGGAALYMGTATAAAPESTFVLLDGTRKTTADLKGRAVAKSWGDVQLTPTTYVVNTRGEIVKRYVGEPDFAELHKLIEKLLAEA